ncbi:P-loop NTPase fold protein [Shewanella algae]|uniref:P-loop NTPase fold protein n=1 Tax=Shewanella algae TaxID=38313 RepID=UPI0031F572CF
MMVDKIKRTGYSFRILNENVPSQDLFEDRTHERVSSNLYQIIKSAEQGVTIGLEGEWGSGKSTVINLLRKQLIEEDEKTLFFMFDAWAHEGDPLRRIFLESLINVLDPEEKHKYLIEIKNKISGRTKTVEVKSKKSTSRLGKFISLSALTIPIGVSLLNKTNYSEILLPWSENATSIYWIFIFGVIFSLSPVWVLILWKLFGDRDSENKISWEFFSTESTEDYSQDITENSERTSIEFEEHFTEIIRESIRLNVINKCIIVIDNLDRVDSEQAKNIWSTLQTFFQRRSSGNGHKICTDNTWFIIPFDREGFKKIWKSSDDDCVGDSFIKKCFQIIAEVPQPVMSGWSKYAEDCIEESLNGWSQHDKEKALSTFIKYTSRRNKFPTPRDIKVFVNQVGLFGSMWGGEMSIEAISLYALFKQSLATGELRKTLALGELPENYKTDNDKSNILSEIAGLLFGVTKDKGLQLLLGPEIYSSFKDGDGNRLQTLAQQHGYGFWVAYESSRSLWMPTIDHSSAYKTSFTKALYTGLKDYKKQIRNEIYSISNIWITSFTKLDLSESDYVEPIDSVFKLTFNKNDFISSIKKLTQEKLSALVSTINSEKFSEKVLVNISIMAEFLKSKNYPLEKLLYSKLTIDNWKVWINQIDSRNVSLDNVLPKKDTIKQLAEETQFNATSINEKSLYHLVKTYKIYPQSNEWQDVAMKLASWLNIPNRNHECEEIYSFAITLAESSDENISNSVKSSVKNQNFWTAGCNSQCTTNPSLPILVALSYSSLMSLQDDPNISAFVKSFWNSTEDEALLSKIYNQFLDLDKIDLIWELCRDPRNKTAINIIRAEFSTEQYESWAGANYIDEYSWADENEINNLAENLITHGSFKDNMENMVDDPLTYQSVFKIFYSIKNKGPREFINKEIKKTSKESWMNCLLSNGDLLSLVNNKNHIFSEALTDYLNEVVSLDNNFNIKQELIPSIPELLSKATDLHKTIAPKITESYFNSEKDYLDDDLFNVLSPLFEEHLKNIDETLVMQRLNTWIDSQNTSRINWVINNKSSFFNEPLESLIGRIQIGLNSENEKEYSTALLINDTFNLGVTKESPPEELTTESTERESV